MLKRARYIHHPEQGVRGNGFSAEIAPNDRGFGTSTVGMCLFRITFCNPKDQFSRAMSRLELSRKEWQEVRVVDVPKLLAEAHFRNLTGGNIHRLHKKDAQYYQNQWAWVYKYFL